MSYRFLAPLAVLLALVVTPRGWAEPDFNAINAAFGTPLFSNDRLWNEVDQKVAERLRWPAESRTSRDASFRRYAGRDERVLGARPFSLALYGRGGNPSEVSMMFANKGDSALIKKGRVDPGYKKQIAADARAVEAALSSVLGAPKVVAIRGKLPHA